MLSSRMPQQFETGAPPPEKLSGYVSVRSQGGKSAFAAKKLARCRGERHLGVRARRVDGLDNLAFHALAVEIDQNEADSGGCAGYYNGKVGNVAIRHWQFFSAHRAVREGGGLALCTGCVRWPNSS